VYGMNKEMINCRMPIISLIAFDDRSAKFIFVRVPNEFGRYLRTHPCVALVPCPYRECGATIGEPCKHKSGYVAGTHALRRMLCKRNPHRMDVIDQNDGAHVTIKTPTIA